MRGLGFQQVVSAIVNARCSATDLWVGDPISRRAAMCGPLFFAVVTNRYVFRLTTGRINHSRRGVASASSLRVFDGVRLPAKQALLARNLLFHCGSPVERSVESDQPNRAACCVSSPILNGSRRETHTSSGCESGMRNPILGS